MHAGAGQTTVAGAVVEDCERFSRMHQVDELLYPLPREQALAVLAISLRLSEMVLDALKSRGHEPLRSEATRIMSNAFAHVSPEGESTCAASAIAARNGNSGSLSAIRMPSSGVL